jgi:agmatine deiminase
MGGSFVCDAFGEVLAKAGANEEVLVAQIDLGFNLRIREGWAFCVTGDLILTAH